MIPLIAAEDWKRKAVSLRPEVEKIVAGIVRDVSQFGDRALLRYTHEFDGVQLSSVRVPISRLEAAWMESKSSWRRVFRAAADNIRRYHLRQRRESWYVDDGDGVRLGQRILPVDRAGLYVPGGTAVYPSSVLMTAIPAQVAGVGSLHLTSPPGPSGLPHPEIMAAAYMLDIKNVYAIGGAQAIAALAFGTASIPSVDKVVGPGNAYVTAAKKLVFGHVDIDSLAGPSELVVLADKTCQADWIAHDLLAQAEHDPEASAILVTPEVTVAEAVCEALQDFSVNLPRADIARLALCNHGAAIVTNSMDEAINMVNKIAPEHLELMVADPWGMLERVRNAGAVFIGSWSPEAVGDYYAGPNHVLPTGGTARFASALGVDDFVTRQSVIGYSQQRLERTVDDIALMARSEGLEGHARSVEARIRVND
ncbi:MAG: histidinol dehydrogenase [Bacteroidetes bacterium]|nr:histidinol dehydrogenase [Bacteroidota bacterium]